MALHLEQLHQIAVRICSHSSKWQALTGKEFDALNNFKKHSPVSSLILLIWATEELTYILYLLWEADNSFHCIFVAITVLMSLESCCRLFPIGISSNNKCRVSFGASEEFPFMLGCHAQVGKCCIQVNAVVLLGEQLAPLCSEWPCCPSKCALWKQEAFVGLELLWLGNLYVFHYISCYVVNFTIWPCCNNEMYTPSHYNNILT